MVIEQLYSKAVLEALPKPGDVVKNRYGFRARVDEIFDGGKHPGMLLSWVRDGKRRGQAFTTEDFSRKWKIVHPKPVRQV